MRGNAFALFSLRAFEIDDAGIRVEACWRDLRSRNSQMLNSHPIKLLPRVGPLLLRMKIAHWELSIGQILPGPYPAKLILRSP